MRTRWRNFIKTGGWKPLGCFLLLVVAVVAYSLASEKWTQRYRAELDLHSGALRKFHLNAWGNETITEDPVWFRPEAIREVFPEKTEPLWLLVSTRETRVLPHLRRRGRSRGFDPRKKNLSWPITINLSQVLDAPHLDAGTKRRLIHMSVPTDQTKPTANYHILDALMLEVLRHANFSDAAFARWKTSYEQDLPINIPTLLNEAKTYPPREEPLSSTIFKRIERQDSSLRKR